MFESLERCCRVKCEYFGGTQVCLVCKKLFYWRILEFVAIFNVIGHGNRCDFDRIVKDKFESAYILVLLSFIIVAGTALG